MTTLSVSIYKLKLQTNYILIFNENISIGFITKKHTDFCHFIIFSCGFTIPTIIYEKKQKWKDIFGNYHIYKNILTFNDIKSIYVFAHPKLPAMINHLINQF
jgi:hypothetical protein